MMNQFYKKVRVKKVLVILGVFFLLLQFQPGTKLLNLWFGPVPDAAFETP